MDRLEVDLALLGFNPSVFASSTERKLWLAPLFTMARVGEEDSVLVTMKRIVPYCFVRRKKGSKAKGRNEVSNDP